MMMKLFQWIKFKHYLLAVLTFFTFFVNAQTPTEELNTYKKEYPDDNIINDFVKYHAEFFIKDEKLLASLEIEEQSFLLTNKASYYAKEQVSSSHIFKLDDIEAYSLIPTPKKYIKNKVSNYIEKDMLDGMSFHDDTKLKIFEYDNLKEGAKTYLKYRYHIIEPALLGSFNFQKFSTTELSQLSVKVQKGMDLGYYFYQCDSVDIIEEIIHEKNGDKTYIWKVKNMEKLKDESGSPNYKYFTPQIIYYIKSYTLNNEKKTLLDSPKGLHQYYTGFLDSINKFPDEALQEVTASLINEEMTEIEKVKAIYQWVQDNIKYVAFEDGYGGFIPRQAKEIFERRFGDCKDMASIIHEMLKYADIESHWTWIGSRSIPFKYTEVPTPSVDNHMINTYINNGKFYFLDGTSSETPFGMPTSFIQGKEALIHINKDSFIIQQVPEIPAETNLVSDSVFLKINDNKIMGNGRYYFHGYKRNEIIHFLSDKDGDNRKDYVKSYVRKGTNKFELIDYKEFNKVQKELPYKIDFNFSIPDYTVEVDDKMYINLNLEKILSNLKLEKDRKSPFEFDYKQSIETYVELEIPNDYSVDYLPENNSYSNDLFSYNSVYEQTDTLIKYKQTIKLNFLILEKKHFNEFNDFLNQLKLNTNEVVVLKK